MEDPIHIDVHLMFMEEADRSRMKITIKDTGRGFDPDILRELQSGRSVENDRGERTGIWNVQRRLKLLYKEQVDIDFANDLESGGAVVEIILPIHPRMEVTT
jgi:two-component system sensor histidine kinase YesM